MLQTQPTGLALDYLLSRGYTEEDIRIEAVTQVPFSLAGAPYPTKTTWNDREIRDCSGHIGWQVFSMSGEPIGLQTRPPSSTEKHYRFHQLPNTEHLPLVYGTTEDWRILWETGKLILTEGAFDRVALKRAAPNRAVLARMSKGAPNQLRHLLKRYATALWLAFDNDEAGKEATEDTEIKLDRIVQTHRIQFPYKDPSLALARMGMQRFRQSLEKQLQTTEM